MTDLEQFTTNSTNTVGLVRTGNPKPDFIGEFTPALIKEWADEIVLHMGEEDVVYLSVHKNPDPTVSARTLCAAAEHGGEVQVMVCGVECNDIPKEMLK